MIDLNTSNNYTETFNPHARHLATMLNISEIAPNLALGDDGIWISGGKEAVSYPQEGNQACFQIEDSSFWFIHRNACIAASVKNFPPPGNGAIFDIGGGNGFVSLGLTKAGFETVLVEPGLAGASNGKQRGLSTVICATTTDAGFKSSTLDAIGLFDVVEHIDNDLQFLESMRDLLKPRGRMYVTVPAFFALWSREDELAGHFRRYTCDSIGALIERAGLKLEYSTYFFRPLPLPIFLLRSLPHRIGINRESGDEIRDHKPGNRAAAAVLDALLSGEVKNIERRRRMTFGASCLLVATVP